MSTTAYAGDSADKFMCKRNMLFSSSGTNFLSKSSGTNATADSWALLRKMLLVSGPDQRVRGLVKNVTKGMFMGWASVPDATFDLCIQVVKTTKAIQIFEFGVQKGSSYGTANEDSEFSIRLLETAGVLGVVYLWRPHAGDPETTMYTSLQTDSTLRHIFPSTFKCVLMDNDGATQPDNSAIETVTLEGDAANVVDCSDIELGQVRVNYIEPLNTRLGIPDNPSPDDIWMITGPNGVNGVGSVKMVPAIKSDTVKKWEIVVVDTITGTLTFQVQVNGANVFGTPLTITNAAKIASSTEAFDIAVGDKIELMCTAVSGGGSIDGLVYLRMTM